MAEVGEVKYKVTADDSGLDSQISKSESKLKAGFGKVAGAVGAAATTAVAAGAAAVVSLTKQAVSAYADYEQLIGGVETLFGDAADFVQDKADQAFKTAGISANDYMETVTSFSASLIQSLGGDTAEAARLADQAIIDMADNANKMGSDMASIQNAYQGFAKQNYTMLDNLKLGYGGTKEEMQRLLNDAEKLSGIKYDISSYADVVSAIHVMQQSMGIAGTTAKEAATTISGSLNSMKSAWKNMLTAFGTGDSKKVTQTINELVQSVQTFAGNLIPVIGQVLQGISQMVAELAPVLAKELPAALESALPPLLNSAASVVKTLAEGILAALPSLMPTVTKLITDLATMIIELAPQIVQVGLELIAQLALGIAEALPELIPTLVETIIHIVEVLTDPSNIQMIIEAAIELVLGLAKGIVEAIPMLIKAIPTVISNLVKALTDPSTIGMLVQGAIDLVVQLVTHLPEIIWGLICAIPDIIMSILDAFGPIGEGLKNLFSAAWEGIKSVFSGVADWFGEKFTQAKEAIGNAWSNVKGFFANTWDGIKGVFHDTGSWFKDKFTQAKENSVNAWSNVKSLFGGVWDRIKSAFSFKDALQWGKDMIQNFIDGIKSMFGKIGDACSNVASKVKSFLGFSEPDEGPLSNFHTFAPDMMDLYAKGIEDNIDKVEDSVADVSRVIAGSFESDVNYNMPDIAGYAADLSAALTAQASTEIVIPITLDGREIARGTAWYMSEQLAWETR